MFAQSAENCPVSHVILSNPLATPEVTADSGDLRGFALSAKRYLESDVQMSTSNPDAVQPLYIYFACLARTKGPWNSGANYVVTISTPPGKTGRVVLHANDSAFNGRLLRDDFYQELTQAVGLDDNGVFTNPDGDFLPGSGYAFSFIDFAVRRRIGVVGLGIDESYFQEEIIDPGDPKIRADQVVDRETLKTFVQESSNYMANLIRTEGLEAFDAVKVPFRTNDGRWRHDSVYIHILNSSGYLIFHGAFPERELQNRRNILRDEVTGELIIPQIIQAGLANLDGRRPDSGFVQYHYDNPADDSDSADILKLSYALARRIRGSPLIFASGFYQRDSVQNAGRRSWLDRFGGIVARHLIDALQERFRASPHRGAELTIAGENLTSAPPLLENASLLSKALGFETVPTQELVEDSSFSLAAADWGTGAQLAFWARGALDFFRGKEEDVFLEGDVTTLLLGADWTGLRWRGGSALSYSWSNGLYDGNDDFTDGAIKTTLWGLFPYGRYALTPRLGIWAAAGYGYGDVSVETEGARGRPNPITMTMGATGMDGTLLDGGSDGLSLSSSADALFLSMHTSETGLSDLSNSTVSGLRVGLEATRPFPLAHGASLTPSMEMGIRQDWGDAETGFGVDIRAGLFWTDPERGISGELKGRTLLIHAAEDYQNYGLALSFAWDPIPSSNRGPTLSVGSSLGASVDSDLDVFLGPSWGEVTETIFSSEDQQQFEVRFAYGFPTRNNHVTVSPALAWILSPGRRITSLGFSFSPFSGLGFPPEAEPWEVSLEGERQQSNTSTTPDYSLQLEFSLFF